MKIDRPLVNPTPREVEAHNQSANSYYRQLDPSQISKDQLAFRTDTKKTTLKQMLNSWKLKLKKRNEMLEVSPLWKYPALPFMFIFSIFNILVFLVGGIIKFGDIPPKIPFFYNAADNTWSQLDKSIVFFFPIFLAVLLVIQLNIIGSIFKKDRRLAITLAWVNSFLNLLLFLTVSQIYYLIT